MRVGSTVPRKGARMAIASMTSRMTPPKMTAGLRIASSHRLLRLVDAAAMAAEFDDFFGLIALNSGSSGRTGCS